MSTPIKSVLVTHAQPADENSPYFQLARNFNLKIDFADLIRIEGVPTPEFRKQNIQPLEYSAIIFTGKIAIDHFFRICKDLRVEMPAEIKYFCVAEATAKYLQKYITIRKRKLFVGERSTADLIPLVKKQSNEKYLIPSGESAKSDLTDFMQQNGFHLREAMVYQTVYNDLTDLKPDKYDLVAFFSPQSIGALMHYNPAYNQGKQVVAVFGKQTAKAAEAAGLRIDIEAPKPDMPSMTMAIEHYLRTAKAAAKAG